MWESTAAMAQAILDGATRPGVSASLISVRRSNLTYIASEVLDAAAVAFGSATLNRGMMPMAAATLCYLEGLRPLSKAAVAFGSYGWGPGGPEAVDQALRRLDWEILRAPLRCPLPAHGRHAGRMPPSRPIAGRSGRPLPSTP